MYRLFIRLEEFLSPFLLGCMVLIIIFQVSNRYLFTYSMDWPEELGRFLFLFAVYHGAGYAELKGRHLEITILRTLFKQRFDKALQIISKMCNITFCLVLTWWGWDMVFFVKDSEQLAPALQIPMYFVYICLPVSMLFMCIHSSVHLLRLFGLINNPPEQSL